MPSNALQHVIVALNATVIVGLVTCICVMGYLLAEQNSATRLLGNTKNLGQELRQSSDDLTRFIRVFTTTNNASYWGYFQQVIRIRDGIDPLPVDPWRNYWDLFIAEGAAPNGFTAPSAILERMAAAEFTNEEFDLLATAKAESDALIDLEDVAYHAMIGQYRPTDTTGLTASEARAFSVSAPPNQTYAIAVVHGVQYHQSKGRIMRPLDAAIARASRRVEDATRRVFEINIVVICVLSAMLLCLITGLAVYFGKIAREAQTQQLLSTVLPERVVSAVPVQRFAELKAAAAAHAAQVQTRRRRHGKKHRGGVATAAAVAHPHQDAVLLDGTDFPVLYAEFLSLAWVAFTDVVRFTDMCRYSSSRQVISTLNELFSLLDVEAANYGIEKIKTIGDAFMCAKLTTAGLTQAEVGLGRDVAGDGAAMLRFLFRACDLASTVARPQPPEGTGHAPPAPPPPPPAAAVATETTRGDSHDAVEYLQKQGSAGTTAEMEEDTRRQSAVLHLRCGLHVGPVASGIVGFERPLFDLFGDTVNTAARLEASGTADCVHVMETAIMQLDGLDLQLLPGVQVVPLKGIGEVRTRLIAGAGRDGNGTAEGSSRSSSDGGSSVGSGGRRYAAATAHTADWNRGHVVEHSVDGDSAHPPGSPLDDAVSAS